MPRKAREKVVSFPKVKRVKGEKNLVRDTETSAVLSADPTSYSVYMKQKQFRDGISTKLESHEKDLIDIKTDISSIKKLLIEIAGRLNEGSPNA